MQTDTLAADKPREGTADLTPLTAEERRDTLCLVLAGGIGRRVREDLRPDEQVKQMLPIRGEPLIKHVLDELRPLGGDLVVLSQDRPTHRAMNATLSECGVRLLIQRAPLWRIPRLLDLPFILGWQYATEDRKGPLHTHRSLLIVPSDLLFTDMDFAAFLSHHWSTVRSGPRPVVSLLGKASGPGGNAAFLTLRGREVVKWHLRSRQAPATATRFVHAGVFALTTSVLSNPLCFLSYSGRPRVTVCMSAGDWVDYGNPSNIRRLRRST